MKHYINLAIIALVFSACSDADKKKSGAAGEEALQSETSQTYTVNSAESSLVWHGEKAFVEGQHNGNVKISEGIFALENGIIQSGNFEIDMTSISVTDEMDEEWRQKLEGHLNSADFFNTDSFPKARFAVVSGDKDSVTANLTIKGITRSIRVPYTMVQDEVQVRIHSEFEIDRAEWNVRYGSGSFFENLGDDMISDEVQFTADLVAKRM